MQIGMLASRIEAQIYYAVREGMEAGRVTVDEAEAILHHLVALEARPTALH